MDAASPIMSDARVGLIVLNWNGAEFTIPCVQSVLQGRITPSRIVIVDNGSTDGSVERIRKQFPSLDLQANSQNLGFTGGNNGAIEILLQSDVEYVWLLNNDTEVAPDCLAKMLATA